MTPNFAESPLGLRLLGAEGFGDLLYARGESGETDRLNEAGVPSLCLATSDAIWGIAGTFEKFQSTNNPLADWRRFSFIQEPDPENPDGYDKWRNAVLAYDPTTYFSDLAAVGAYLTANGGIFGGLTLPGTGNPIIAGNLAGAGSNVLYATNTGGVWTVTESTRPLIGGDATWVRRGTYERKIIGYTAHDSAWHLIGDGNDGSGGGGGTSVDYPDARHSLATGITAWQIIDSGVFTNKVSGVKWLVTVTSGSSVEQYEIQAIHNGSASVAATACGESGPFTVTRVGTAIPGVLFRAVLTGSGATQKLALKAGADIPATFKTRMEWTQHATTRLTLAQLEGV